MMPIHSESSPNDSGRTVWYLDHPAQLAELPTPERAWVSRRAEDFFTDCKRALGALRDRMPLPAGRAWLASLQGARCVMEVHDIRQVGWGGPPNPGGEVRFRFEVERGSMFHPSFTVDPRAPRLAVPGLVTELHAICADIEDTGARLIPLDQVISLRELEGLTNPTDEDIERIIREYGMDPETARLRALEYGGIWPILQARPELATSVLVLENGCGTSLCATADGEGVWTSGDDDACRKPQRPRALSAELDRFFQKMLDGDSIYAPGYDEGLG